MILWLLLFALVLALSFVLAARSMRNFQDITGGGDFGLFLIRKPQSLSTQLLSSIKNSLKPGQVLSFERLFKGAKSTLVVFGPKELLGSFRSLDLLELEDYTNVKVQQISGCFVEIKSLDQLKLVAPKLQSEDQFWWQVSLSHEFRAQILAVLVSSDPLKRAKFLDFLQNLLPPGFKLLKTLSEAQILEIYKKRMLLGSKQPSLSAHELLELISL